MKTITLEEHFVTADFMKATAGKRPQSSVGTDPLQAALMDLGENRIKAMDEGGIDLQVLSLAALGLEGLASEQQVAVLHDVHEELAAAVRAHPDRFAAFATPPLKQPAAAAKELEHCVRVLGFKGAMFDGTTEGKFLDAPEFFPVWEAAAALGVPVYLHPAPPPQPVKEMYFGNLPGETGELLSIAGWGWHAENGLHILRLILSGLFDKLPPLQVIIGHMGEGIPYALARSNGVLSAAAKNLKRSITETFLGQVHITTSGYFTTPPFTCCREVVGLERMMYSVDYPFSANTRGKQFLEALDLPGAELASLAYGNAAKLLQLDSRRV